LFSRLPAQAWGFSDRPLILHAHPHEPPVALPLGRDGYPPPSSPLPRDVEAVQQGMQLSTGAEATVDVADKGVPHRVAPIVVDVEPPLRA